MHDRDEAVTFMQRFSFATIVSLVDKIPEATHLPFLTTIRGDKIVVTSHFAKANLQWKAIESQDNLVIFTEPHAYISPANYENKLSVPTWNYIAVHAYGEGKIIDDPTAVRDLLESTIAFYDKTYQNEWLLMPEDYKNKLSAGIVAFEIEVKDLQGKKKLSQNRSEQERLNIINHLEASNSDAETMISEYMKRGK